MTDQQEERFKRAINVIQASVGRLTPEQDAEADLAVTLERM